MRSTFVKVFPYLVIGFFAVVGLWSLAHSPFYTSHDGVNHTTRIAAYFRALSDRQFPPRWATNMNGTLGSPIFVYSYPLPYFIGGLIHLAGVDYQDTFRTVMAFSFVFGGLSMYWWLRGRVDAWSAVVGAVFYMWVPYRFLNLYVRAAFAEAFAYALLPLWFMAADRCFGVGSKKVALGLLALVTAAVLLSHNVVAFMVLPVVGLYAGLKTITTKNRLGLGLVILGIIWGLLISSFIYVPDLLERGFIRFDAGISYYREHFVALWQLIRSPWDYGFDLPGTVNDRMSFQLGLAHLLSLVLFVVFLAVNLIRKRRKKTPVQSREPVYFLLVFFGAVFLMVQSPGIITVWKAVPLLTTVVDFPWRFLGVAAFALAVLAAYTVYFSPSRKVLALVLLLAVLVANRNFTRVNEKLSYNDAFFDRYTGSSTAQSDEYLPILHKSPHLPLRTDPVQVISGQATVNIVSRNASGLAFTAEVSTPTRLRINRFFFPETKIFYNGVPLEKDKDWVANREISTPEFDDTGTIHLKVLPPGGLYSLMFEETKLRKIADVVSASAFLVALGLMFFRIKGRKKWYFGYE